MWNCDTIEPSVKVTSKLIYLQSYLTNPKLRFIFSLLSFFILPTCERAKWVTAAVTACIWTLQGSILNTEESEYQLSVEVGSVVGVGNNNKNDILSSNRHCLQPSSRCYLSILQNAQINLQRKQSDGWKSHHMFSYNML